MSVSIYAGDFNKGNVKDGVNSGTSINYKENNAARAYGVNGAFGGVIVSDGQDNSRLKDNTYESLLKEADDVRQQIMDSAKTAQISFKALVKKLSGMEAVDISGEGFNIMDSSPDEMVSIIDKIRVELAMHSDDYVAYGTGVSKSTIEKAAGVAGVSSDVVERLSGAGVSIDEDSLREAQAALDKASGIVELSEKAKYYMISNDIAPTIDGIYKAEMSVAGLPQNSGYQISFQEFNAMRPQIESLIGKSGLAVNLQNLNNAQELINNNIPVTEKTLKYKAMLDTLNLAGLSDADGQSRVLDKIADQMAIGGEASDTPLTNDPSIWENVKSAIVTLADASYDDIMNVISSGKAFTISSLKVVMQVGWSADSTTPGSQQGMYTDQALMSAQNQQGMYTGQALMSAQNQQGIYTGQQGMSGQNQQIAYTGQSGMYGQNSYAAMGNYGAYQYSPEKAYNTLLEARMLLTAGSGIILERNNTPLLYTPLDEITEKLKTMEADGAVYAGNVQMYNDVLDVRKALYDIEIAPAQMYEKLMNSDPYKLSISMVSNVASSLRSRYARAIGTYKTVGTQIREDLDDSILKAVNNSANGIIDKLELENTQENRDVIKLLASNNIDITKESVERARKIYSTLNNLVNNMKPETVVKMIDAGINPMNTDIWTVNDYLSRMNQGATKDNEEKYSRFLYKLEKTSGISETKKKQFIGIYQMMNIFTRDAGVCAGALMKQGKEITMGNLISAYTSRKHSGIDVTIDDTVGFTKEDKDMVSYFESLFAKSQQYITPNTLKESDINTPIEDQHVEHFAENLLDNYDEKLEKELDSSYIQDVTQKAADADAEVTRELRRAGINENIGNINAVNELLATGELMAYTRALKGKGIGNADKSGHNHADKNNSSKAAYIDSSEKLSDVLSGREKLEALYTNLEEAAGDELEEAIESSLTDTDETPVDYDTFEELRISNRQIRYISNLARKNDYRIPYVKNGKAGLINLTFLSDSSDKGKISIKMDTEAYGELSMEAKITGKDISLFVKQNSNTVHPDDRSIYKSFEELENVLKLQHGMNSVRINTVRVPDVNYVTYENSGASVPADELYRIAQSVTGVFFGK